MVEKLEKTRLNYSQAGLGILVILGIFVFCQFVGFSLIIPLLVFFLGLHLFFFNKNCVELFWKLGLLLMLMVVTAFLFVTYFDIPALYIPVASVAILTALLFDDLGLSFVMSFLSSALVALIIQPQLSGVYQHLSAIDLLLIFFLGNLTAAYTIRDARTRGKFFSTGVCISVIEVVSLILLHHEMALGMWREFAFYYIRPLLLNGLIAALVAISTLKIFEYLFGALTNFSLLELSDKDQPLLKQMSLEAPGTYHHSMVVSDMSEAAADAIGANALLTRIGAYYHDVGKTVKPEYFTENQLVGGNKHDMIEPSMSRLVILNHVKEGMELAKKFKLNPKIIDFIPQHHGTGLMYYFYQKALEEAESPESVKEENFRYPGPKPQSRETAIVLLADSVEGAVRAMDDPTPVKIEETVRKVINNKFIDGQLDECLLTLKEIHRISATFTRVLSAMYHGRIKYPGKKNGSDHRNRKQTEKDSSESQSNPQARKKNPPA
ncbi:MAG: HDIG domain-containing protein [Candidatus Omnitrophica bacterium]|nr:HDIG domain-containing protein [Candidatus Omnitrophota bacterium]